MIKLFKKRISNFKRDENGSMAIELLLVTPILVWVLLATFVYFDVFRVEATSNKAAITISEMLSREEVPITDEYLDSALSVLQALTYEEDAPDLRVTVYHYNTEDSEYQLIWSEARGDFATVRSDADLTDFETAGILPLLNGSDHAILVETRVQYNAPFSLGFGDFSGLNLDKRRFRYIHRDPSTTRTALLRRIA